MARIAILDDYQDVARKLSDWSRLEKEHEVVVFTRHLGGVEQCAEALAPFDVVAITRERTAFPRALIEKLTNLKLIATAGMRNAAIDMAAAKERGIMVCGTSSTPHSTSELTMALILAFARNLAYEDRRMREGHWQSTVGTTLHGRTLGVVGLGKQGGEVAHLARAFGMKLIGWSQNMTDEQAAKHGATRVSKEELFRTADVVTLHLVLSDRTRGIVGAPELALMQPTAFIVNTSRGPLIDEKALLEALHAGRIKGAAIDVYETEPLPPDHPLRSAPRTLLSPHLGYVSEETLRVFHGQNADSIAHWLAGSPVRVLNG
ncbi:MAG: D-2-hydroxyacid dehydrogenase family protein [Hyphomicrobiaceae bacterium]